MTSATLTAARTTLTEGNLINWTEQVGPYLYTRTGLVLTAGRGWARVECADGTRLIDLRKVHSFGVVTADGIAAWGNIHAGRMVQAYVAGIWRTATVVNSGPKATTVEYTNERGLVHRARVGITGIIRDRIAA